MAAASETISLPSTRAGIDLEILFGLLGVLGSVDQDKLVFDPELFEQHVRRCVCVRREIVKVIHGSLPVLCCDGRKLVLASVGHNKDYPTILAKAPANLAVEGPERR
jgi:hypothetical protein